MGNGKNKPVAKSNIKVKKQKNKANGCKMFDIKHFAIESEDEDDNEESEIELDSSKDHWFCFGNKERRQTIM